MVVARVLSKTGIFERVGAVFLRATGGSGKRYLLLLVLLVAPVCAFLPNATTVILLAPVIIRVAQTLEVDFVGPMVLAAIISNSAGMLTLVGDPATFLVGSSIGLSFGQYLQKVSFGGLLAVLVILPLLPRLMPEVWRARCALPPEPVAARIERPGFALFSLAILLLMVVLFLFGEELPTKILPPAVAIVAATLALLGLSSAGGAGGQHHSMISTGRRWYFSAPFFVWCKDSPRPVCCKGWRFSSKLGSALSLIAQRWCCWRGSGFSRVCWPTYRWSPPLW